MAIAGAGLVAAGIGLGIVGTALIAPAVFAWHPVGGKSAVS